MSHRLVITLKDKNYELLNNIANEHDNLSMSKILNILAENFLDEKNLDFFKTAILKSKNNETQIISENKKIEAITKVIYEHEVGKAPNMSINQLIL